MWRVKYTVTAPPPPPPPVTSNTHLTHWGLNKIADIFKMADNVCSSVSLNQICCILLKISSDFFTKGSVVNKSTLDQTMAYPDSKVDVAHMGPTWGLSAPGRPHVGPMNLAIRAVLNRWQALLWNNDGLVYIYTSSGFTELTPLPWTKWPPFRRRHLQMHFLVWEC